MHFWIDKRSQTCGFSGRHRIPSSLSGGCGQQRRRRRRSRGKLMVTPVHRFQPIESSGLGLHGSRRSHHHRQLQHNYLPPGYTTARSNGAHPAEIDTSVFLDIPLASNGDIQAHNQPANLVPVGTLRCGIWASFALATVFVAGIKLYFDHQGSGLEVLVFFALLVVFLLAGCTASMCRSRLQLDLQSAAVPPSLGHASVTTVGDSEIIIDDEVIRSPSTTPAVSQQPPPVVHVELPPPPYHIAILLPQQQRSSVVIDESPPPSYDKVVG